MKRTYQPHNVPRKRSMAFWSVPLPPAAATSCATGAARAASASPSSFPCPANRKAKPRITATDRLDGLRGARYVVITISTGGLDAMGRDLAIPERFGIYHTVGDTSGPGGRPVRTLRRRGEEESVERDPDSAESHPFDPVAFGGNLRADGPFL